MEESGEKISIPGYDTVLSQAFKRYYSEQRFCNVMLSVEGQIIHAHQEILSASSPWFDHIFQSVDRNHQPIIFLKDMKLNEIESVLKLLYFGEVSIKKDKVDQFMKVGESLQIKGLQNLPKESTVRLESTTDALNSYQTETLTNQYEAIRNDCLPVSLEFQIAKKSAPEIGKDKRCITRTQSVNTQDQINLFVSETSLEMKNNPITSISIHHFAQENTRGKVEGSIRKEVAKNISSYSQGLIQSCSIKATTTSQVSLPMQSENKETTLVTSCHLPINQDLTTSHIPTSASQNMLAASSSGRQSIIPSDISNKQELSASTNMLSQGYNKVEPVTPPGVTSPSFHNTSPTNIASCADKKYPKPKKRKIYESAAPVYDNRQIFAADLLQTQLDYAVDEAGEDCEELVGDSVVDLALVSGTEDYGPFKKVWSETFLCYNLGKEIICLLCFCRFTQFKKYNLNRHMEKKHNQYYQLSAQIKRKCLVEFARRYEEYVTSTILTGVPAQGNTKMAQDILQLRNIDWVELLGEDFTMFDSLYTCQDNLTLPSDSTLNIL